jgi:dimethylaniline monooxygenase (N-oxide forming)
MNEKSICVIGAGFSGIRVLKDLKYNGFSDIVCFEKNKIIGGLFTELYDNMRFVSSNLLSSWSDYSDGYEKAPYFWSASDYTYYCNGFIQKYDLMKYIQFNTLVYDIKREEDGKWIVKVINTIDLIETIFAFDAIAVCTGTNVIPYIPVLPGQENFKGKIIHSKNYKNSHCFTGKNVLILGGGESAADIMKDISNCAKKVALAIRGQHGHIIPRHQENGRVTDLNTNRCRYSNPFILGNFIGFATQFFKYFLNIFKTGKTNKIFKEIAILNMSQGTSAFTKYGCKSSGFVEAMVKCNSKIYRGNVFLRENDVLFDNGDAFTCDIIIACTGYKYEFKFLKCNHPVLNYLGMNPRLNYKQMFCPLYPGEIAFIGFVRPAFGAVPAIVELQSRLFSYVLKGLIDLPEFEEMCDIAKKDKLEWEKRFNNDHNRVGTLVDYQLYCDDLAKIMGITPPIYDIFFKDPHLWLKIMLGPLTTHQYRLKGVEATPELSMETIKKYPIGDFMESTITMGCLLFSKLLYMMGFEKFKPNNF